MKGELNTAGENQPGPMPPNSRTRIPDSGGGAADVVIFTDFENVEKYFSLIRQIHTQWGLDYLQVI